MNMNCPMCQTPRKQTQAECSKCGLIFAKYRDPEQRQETEQFHKQQECSKAEKSSLHTRLLRSWVAIYTSCQGQVVQLRKHLARFIVPSPRNIFCFSLIIILSVASIYFVQANANRRNYILELDRAILILDDATLKCAEMCETYRAVWRQSIQNEYDDDFNDNLRNQRSNFVVSGAAADLEKSKKIAEYLLKTINSSTDFYPAARRKLLELYSVYSQLQSLAAFPSGSLQSYSAQVNKLQSEYIRVANELKVLMPATTNN